MTGEDKKNRLLAAAIALISSAYSALSRASMHFTVHPSVSSSSKPAQTKSTKSFPRAFEEIKAALSPSSSAVSAVPPANIDTRTRNNNDVMQITLLIGCPPFKSIKPPLCLVKVLIHLKEC